MADTTDKDVAILHRDLLDAWNRRDASGMAAFFVEDGGLIGFDGSHVEGRAMIEDHLRPIFADHPTAAFVGKVRRVARIAEDVAHLTAIVGMVPPGKSDIKPEVNAIQTLLARREKEHWRVCFFQNTPAAFHGRPEESETLTDELREVLKTLTDRFGSEKRPSTLA
jgi:uncharacterized protein (TIGR02246 family)